MCFRTSNTKSAKENEERFDASFNIPEIYKPYYHMAGFEPLDMNVPKYLYIIKQGEYDVIEPSYWGIMSEFSDISQRNDLEPRFRPTNKRAETLFQKDYWRKIVKEQRCLILADGFYEPHRVKRNGKDFSIPHYCKLEDHSLFAFAGIYTELGEGIYTASIITTIANPFFEEIHNVKKQGTYRMPIVLDEYDENVWLEDDLPEGEVENLLFSFTKKKFEAIPVSKDIDFGKNPDRPDIINKAYYPELTTLF